MEEYQGEVIPFEEYQGEVLPLEESDIQSLNKSKAESENLNAEIQAKRPQNSREDFLKGTGDFAEPIETEEQQAQVNQQKAEQEQNTAKPLGALKGSPLGVPIALGKGILNSGTNINAVGLALGDTARTAFGQKSNMTGEYLNSGLASNYEGTNTGEQILMSAAEQAPGFIAGGGVGKAVGETVGGALSTVGKAISRVPFGTVPGGAAQLTAPVVKYGSKLAGQEMGAAIGQNKKDEGLIVGSGRMIGLDIDPNEPEANKQIKQTINLGLDNALTALTLGVGAKAGGAVSSFLGDMKKKVERWASIDEAEKSLVNQVIEVGLGLSPNSTRAEWKSAQDNLLKLMKEDSKKTYEMGEGVSDAVIKRDPISIMTSQLDPNDPIQAARIKELQKLRTGVEINASKTQLALDAPERMLHDKLAETKEVKGGDGAIDQTRANLQQKARVEAEAENIPVDMMKGDLAETEDALKDTLRRDPDFGPKIRDNETAGVNLDVNKESLDAQDKLLEQTRKARGENVKTRNEAYDRVGDNGALADMDSFNKTFEENKEFIPKNIQDLVEKSDGTFQYLNKEVNPVLSKAIKNARSVRDATGNRESYDALIALKKNIREDQIDYLKKVGDDDTVRLADEANKENIRYSKLHNEGVGEELRKNEGKNLPLKSDTNYPQEGRSILLRTIKDPNKRESIQQLGKIVGPENEHLVSDVALAESMKDIINNGADFKGITSKLQDMSAALSPTQRTRIEGFLTDVRGKKQTIEELKKRIPEFEKEIAQKTDEIYLGKFNSLFEKRFGKIVDVKKGSNSFDELVNSDDASKFDDLIKEAKKDPDDLAGLQVAWVRSTQKKLAGNQRDVVDLPDNFLENGKKIFGDDSKLFKGLIDLRNDAKKILDERRGLRQKVIDGSKPQVELRSVVNNVITWTFGILNPTAARLRTITGDVINKYDATNRTHQAADNILSDPDLFAKHLESVINENKNKLTPAERQTIFRFGVNIGLDMKRDANNQTDEALTKK